MHHAHRRPDPGGSIVLAHLLHHTSNASSEGEGRFTTPSPRTPSPSRSFREMKRYRSRAMRTLALAPSYPKETLRCATQFPFGERTGAPAIESEVNTCRQRPAASESAASPRSLTNVLPSDLPPSISFRSITTGTLCFLPRLPLSVSCRD